MILNPKYRFMRMEEKHFPAIQAIASKAFGVKRSLEEWKRKYDTSWTGIKHVASIAFHDDRPVAFYGAVPQRLIRDGKPVSAVMTCDSFVVPEYQRQGLHRDAGFHSYETMQSLGVQLVYAYHSEQTFISCKKLGWEGGAPLNGYWVPTGAAGLMQLRNKIQPGKWPSVFEKLPQVATLQNSHAGPGILHLDYCPEFFAYRNYTPNRIVRIGNSSVWLKTGGTLMVGDFTPDSPDSLSEDFLLLRKLARKAGYPRILFQVFPGCPLDRLLSKEYDRFDSWKVGYKFFSNPIDWSCWRGNHGDFDTF